jgi:methylenetetrahydrofolate dehydrogenase (NAD+)
MPVTLPKCLDLSAVKVTKPIKALLSKSLSQLDRPLSLVGLLATEDTGCHMYADMTQRACKAADVNFSKLDLTHLRKASNEKAAFDELCTVIERLNKDTTVDGLIVYFPLFTPELDAYLRDLIDPRIDVEGVNPTSLTISCYDAPDLVEEVTANPSRGIVYPCTALAVFRSLQSPEVALYNPALPKGERLRGKTITVLNRYVVLRHGS